ncbi:hypothetical protein MKW92_027656 [Papaver armeniacum]|nr:hypothetical protein MKW92_027656 [Papaver armeniacum]
MNLYPLGLVAKTLRKGLWMMAVGKEVNRIYLAYQPEEEKKLILAARFTSRRSLIPKKK